MIWKQTELSQRRDTVLQESNKKAASFLKPNHVDLKLLGLGQKNFSRSSNLFQINLNPMQ